MAKKKGDRSELLTSDEMHKLLDIVAPSAYFSALYKVLLYSGRRIGEIYGTLREGYLTGGVKLEDVNFETQQMETMILKTKKRKLKLKCLKCEKESSYKNKFCPICGAEMPPFDKSQLFYDEVEKIIIPVRPEVLFALKAFIGAHKPQFKPQKFLFREYTQVYLKKIIKKHCKRAGIKKNFSLHGFRHYFVTQCKRSGMKNEEIALWTGHKNPATLNLYNRMVPKDVEAKILAVEL